MIFALALMLGAPGAQPTPAQRGAVAADEMRDYFGDYARCAVRWNHARASRAVIADLEIKDLEHQFSDIFLSTPVTKVAECRELQMREDAAIIFSGEALRAYLAEALIQAEFKNSGPASLADRAPLARTMPQSQAALEAELAAAPAERRAAIQRRHDEVFGRAWLGAFAECVVRRDTGNARNWLMAAPASADEAAAIKALSPSFGDCLPQGRQLGFRKDMLRGAIAVNYYRLAKAPAAATTGVVH